MDSTSTTYTFKSNSTKPVSSPIQYGWKCPSCGAVMAPWQSSCINCCGSHEPYCSPSITWQSTGDPNPNPWWNQVTCKSGETTTSWNSANTTPTNNSLKSAMKSHGINI
jgi:hypothetical protein